ncbi:MAG: hypothetical protein AMXMBFR48_12460 [Ignavibacteriales bacterium]|jgi:hypothetical protein
MKSVLFPSVIENHDNALQSAINNLVDGIKIHQNGSQYIVGNLALEEGVSPHKIVNANPLDTDYQVLAGSGLLLLSQYKKAPVTLTVGFPYATYKANQDAAIQYFKGKHDIMFDTFSFGKTRTNKVAVEVDRVEVIPEILGCSLAIRNERKGSPEFFVVSIGYGTFEACLTNKNGITERTLISGPGIRYAINQAMRELKKQYYLDLRTEHQFDKNFQLGKIIINRRPHDISEIRSKAIQSYYDEIISPSLRNVWKDDDFMHTNLLFLTGGGSLYPELLECFKKEFGGILETSLVDDPTTSASRGYAIWSNRINDDKSVAAGMDIGNAQTVVTFFENKSENEEF